MLRRGTGRGLQVAAANARSRWLGRKKFWPLKLDIVAAMNSKLLFADWFRGSSWNNWRAVLKGAFALHMSEAERVFFRTVAGRDPPTKPVRELWCVIGRGGGKDSIASLISAYAAALFDRRDRLRPGERALCMCLACDRDQARIVLGYTRSYFESIAPFRAMVRREVASGFELSNGVDIAISTNSYRSVRGRTLLLAIMDECAFWRDERSATPDEETYRAITPGLARMPGSMLIGISTPPAKRGLLYRKYKEAHGRDGDVLVIKAPSLTFNPTLDRTRSARSKQGAESADPRRWIGRAFHRLPTDGSLRVAKASPGPPPARFARWRPTPGRTSASQSGRERPGRCRLDRPGSSDQGDASENRP
jgi:hypothetical protein